MYHVLMAGKGNIHIADQSALHALLHRDWGDYIEGSRADMNPLHGCAAPLDHLRAFNVQHPCAARLFSYAFPKLKPMPTVMGRFIGIVKGIAGSTDELLDARQQAVVMVGDSPRPCGVMAFQVEQLRFGGRETPVHVAGG